MSVDKPSGHACVARKGCMHCIVGENLHDIRTSALCRALKGIKLCRQIAALGLASMHVTGMRRNAGLTDEPEKFSPKIRRNVWNLR